MEILYNPHHHTIHLLNGYNSVAFSLFTELFNWHPCQQDPFSEAEGEAGAGGEVAVGLKRLFFSAQVMNVCSSL